VSGSSIVVCTIAMGTVVYFGTKARKTGSFTLQAGVKQQALLLLISSIVPLLLCIFGCNAMLGTLGVGSYVAFLLFQITKPKEVHHHGHGHDIADPSITKKDLETGEKKVESATDTTHTSTTTTTTTVDHPTITKEESSSDSEHEQPLYKGVGYLVVGGALILIFSEPFITAVVNLAAVAHVNPILFAFFLAPIASEMPEILESISLSRKGRIQNLNIAVSNLLGGTITKTTFLCGLFAFYGVYKQFPWEAPNYTISYALLLVCACIASGPMYYFHSQKRWNSIILFGTFGVAGLFQYFFNSTYTEGTTQPLSPAS